MKKRIYILKSEYHNLLKIGVSDDPTKRAKTIKTVSGLNIEVAYVTSFIFNFDLIERKIHLHFKDYHHSGEWFNVDLNTAIEYIESIHSEFLIDENFTTIDEELASEIAIRYCASLPPNAKKKSKYIYVDSNYVYYVKVYYMPSYRIIRFLNYKMALDYVKKYSYLMLEWNKEDKKCNNSYNSLVSQVNRFYF
jgi:hypothetical protein